MKRSMKRWLAMFLALSMAVAPAMSIRAEEVQVTGDELAAQGEVQEPENEPAAQEEVQVQGTGTAMQEKSQGELNQQKEQIESSKLSENAGISAEVRPEADETDSEDSDYEQQVISEMSVESAGTSQETGGEDTGAVPGTNLLTSDGSVGSYTDGIYQAVVTSSLGMLKTAADPVPSAVVSGDKVTLSFTTTKGTYDKLYFGDYGNQSEEEAVKGSLNSSGTYDFTIELSQSNLGEALSFVAGKPDRSWGSKAYEITFTIGEPQGSTVESETPKEEKKEEQEEPETQILESGKYIVAVDSSASMFKVVDCILQSKFGKLTAVITLSGTGYDYLFMGTADEAAGADESAWISFAENADGKYTYEVPVSALDTEIPVASHSKSKDAWYDRTLIFNSDGMKQVSTGGNSGTEETDSSGNAGSIGGSGNTGSSSGTSTVDKTPEAESKYESDLSGSTGKVNNTTGLKDGVYTPDSFSWSGGTGKVKISCSKVTITNGQAYATIVFSSSAYNYVKANGNKYYASHSGDTSIFTIPVELNKNNQIIGMTTKMSAAHEVAYNIFVYLKAAAEANGETVTGMGLGNSFTLDEEAPDILGLEYEEEVVLDYAKYFKIFQYEQGITLLEIDMMSDTAREELSRNVDDADETDTASETIPEEEGSVSEVKTQEDIVAELYQENVVKYLIVPEDVEIPAGLDKEVIVIRRPADKAEDKIYAASDVILEQMEQIDMLEAIAAVACEKEDCQIDQIAEKMEKEEVIYAGTYDEPDYKALISSKCNLAILPVDILPRELDAVGDIDSEEIKDDNQTVEEQEELLKEMMEKYALLGIPMIVDRSLDEEEGLAQKEWVKVYGVLFGCEEKAEEIFEAAVSAEK